MNDHIVDEVQLSCGAELLSSVSGFGSDSWGLFSSFYCCFWVLKLVASLCNSWSKSIINGLSYQFSFDFSWDLALVLSD